MSKIFSGRYTQAQRTVYEFNIKIRSIESFIMARMFKRARIELMLLKSCWLKILTIINHASN